MALRHSSDKPSRAADEPGLSRDEFERSVLDALSHLHDPIYLQTQPLSRFVASDFLNSDAHANSIQSANRAGIRPMPSSRSPSHGRALSQALLDAIDSLSPNSASAPSPRASRRQQVLRLRFVEALEVAEIQERLAISRSAYYVEQRRAVRAVADLLWGKWLAGDQAGLDRVRQISRPSTREERPSHNLPLQLTSLVGREREIAEVKRLLETNRLLTLTGSGGSGKTRLALEIANDLLVSYPDGVFFVELAPLSDPSLVPQTVAFALDVHEVATEPIVSTCMRYLQTRKLLLVLDNCEHLVEACAQYADALLKACPNLTVLSTSREVLRIRGEVAWSVPSLAVPPEDRSSLDDLSRYESVRLFADRAVAARPGFAVTSESASSVTEICRLLGGMPLAIELAAARVNLLTPKHIVERLSDQLDLLTGGSRTALPRQQTLKATIDWSYDLLSEPERVLLRRLAVFANGFTLEAAEAICSDEWVEGRQVLDLLSRLVDKSLVQVDLESRQPYRLLEPIRQYARDRLVKTAESDVIRVRHRDWYLELAAAAEPEIVGADQRTWLDRLDQEHDNIRAALGWCLERDGEVRVGLRLAASLGEFWWMRGYLSEGRQWLEAMLGRGTERTVQRAKALECAGRLTRQQGDFDSARAYFVESLSIFRQAEDKRGIASVLCSLAPVAERQGEPTEAMLQESARLFREVGDEWGTHRALGNLGALAVNQGDLERARPLLDEALQLARKLGRRSSVGWLTAYLGQLAFSAGEMERARDLFEQSLLIFREVGRKQQVGWALLELARLRAVQGDYARAVALLTESLTNVQSVGDRNAISSCLRLSGVLAMKQDKPERAARLAGTAAGAAADSSGYTFSVERTEEADPKSGLDAIRSALGEEAFARAWAEGQAMTLERAVEYALQDDHGS